jgi:hypothetical protein
MSARLDLDDVDVERRAPVALDHIHAQRQQWGREHRRTAALSAREALAALRFEALLVRVAATNVRNGVKLTDEDIDRLTTACRWIDMICDEVLS